MSRILAEVLTATVFGWTVIRAINARIRSTRSEPASATEPSSAVAAP